MTHAEAFFAAFIHESKHPDCLPERRFRVVMPSGVPEWFGTREKATQAFATAVDCAVRTDLMKSLLPEEEFFSIADKDGPSCAAYEALVRWSRWRRELHDDGRDSDLAMLDEWSSPQLIRPKSHVYPVVVCGASE